MVANLGLRVPSSAGRHLMDDLTDGLTDDLTDDLADG